eukprot:14323684-Alexandrium_andersonii.AAC.1
MRVHVALLLVGVAVARGVGGEEASAVVHQPLQHLAIRVRALHGIAGLQAAQELQRVAWEAAVDVTEHAAAVVVEVRRRPQQHLLLDGPL